MTKRQLLGAMIASPAATAAMTLGYWTGEDATWHGWIVMNAVFVGIIWLALLGAAIAFGQSGSDRGR